MTQLTKLGDVAAYLRKGDTFTWNDEQFVFYTNGCGFFSDCVVTNRGTVNLAKEVELLNPRWVTDEETCSKGLAIVGGLRHPTMYATLCRETAGKLEPVRAGELPREVFADEIRVGDEFQRPEEPRVTWLATEVNELRFRMKCVAISAPGVVSLGYVGSQCRRDQVKLVLLSRNNPIPSDTPQPDSLPRLVKGSELRVGDRMLFAAGGDVEEEDAERWNQDGGPFTVVRIDSLSGTRYVRSGKGEDFVCLLGWTVELLSRAEPTTEPPPALDTDRLRDAWQVLTDQIRWQDVAAKYQSEGWDYSPGIPMTSDLVLYVADMAFETALTGNASFIRENAHLFVVLQPDNRDRPIELFAEALNAAAYHAKVAELWPKPVAKVEPARNCEKCNQPIGYGRKLAYHNKCGDCFGRWDAGMDGVVPTSLERALAAARPEPSTHLSLGARYHLNDDVDVFGIPGGNG